MKPAAPYTFAAKMFFLLPVLIYFTVIAFSQAPAGAVKKGKNIVPNPSFETHKNKANVIVNAIPWRNVGTVDYYMKPDKRDTSRFKGARTGTCYAGLRFQADYKEYMYVQLLEPMEKDRTYQFKMYVRILGQSNVAVKQLGVYFSDEVFKVGMTFEEEGIVDSTYKKGLKGSNNWIPITGEYTAHGGEKYIIIGNFRTRMKDDFVKKKKGDLFDFKEAYYYVDDVSLRKILTTGDTAGAKKAAPVKIPPVLPEKVSPEEKFVINDLVFDGNTALIKKAGYRVLDVLVRDLDKHPFAEIEIIGHTDNTGNESANRKLSKERAKAVYDYLKEEGCINTMSYKGLGGTQPLVPNDTEENKAKNRRVEIHIIKE